MNLSFFTYVIYKKYYIITSTLYSLIRFCLDKNNVKNILSESRNPKQKMRKYVPMSSFFLIAAAQDNLHCIYVEVGQLLTAVRHFYLIQCQESYLTAARI